MSNSITVPTPPMFEGQKETRFTRPWGAWFSQANGILQTASTGGGGGAGTVTSVGINAGSANIALSGTNPVTSAGSITIDLSTSVKSALALAASALQPANVADSIIVASSALQLQGDAATPGNSMLYGTNSAGTKGWYAQPASGSSNITADTHPASPTIYDDEFEYGSSIDLTGARSAGAQAWAWLNQSSASTSVGQGSLVMTSALTGSSATNLNGVIQPVPAGSWTFTAKYAAIQGANSTRQGLIVYNSVNTNVALGGVYGSSPALVPIVNLFASPTSYPSAAANTGDMSTGYQLVNAAGNSIYGGGPYYLQLSYDGVNWSYGISLTGVKGSFVFVYLNPVATDIGGAPTHIGMALNAANTVTAGMNALDWWRRTA